MGAPELIRSYCIADAALELGVGHRQLMAALRELGWVNRENVPYFDKVQAGLMVRKVTHPGKDRHDNWRKRITPRLTRLGLRRLQEEGVGSDAEK